MVDVSIVIPVFNERGNLRPLFSSLQQVMEGLPYEYEIIFVDDGSSDGSTKVLLELANQHEHVRLLEFVRNFG